MRESRRTGMRKSVIQLTVALGVFVLLCPTAIKAQTSQSVTSDTQDLMGANGSGGPAPEHDLNGTWIGAGEPQLTIQVPAMTPAGLAKFKKNIPDPFSLGSNDPWKTCDSFGMPREVNNEVRNIGFATMPDRIIILENYGHIWREVWTDGRQLPKEPGGRDSDYSSRWYGYSVGHWENANTLVVETDGMMPQSWVDRRGYPHSLDAKVIERYTRTDHNHLQMTESLDDPAYYTKPWVVAELTYKWIVGEDNPKAATIPFAVEDMCISSEMIRYNNSVVAPTKGNKQGEYNGIPSGTNQH